MTCRIRRSAVLLAVVLAVAPLAPAFAQTVFPGAHWEEIAPGVGYGYLWWMPMRDRHFRTDMGRGSFSARGSGGQFIVVAPEREIVIAHLNDREDNDRIERGAFNELMQLVFEAAPR